MNRSDSELAARLVVPSGNHTLFLLENPVKIHHFLFDIFPKKNSSLYTVGDCPLPGWIPGVTDSHIRLTRRLVREAV